MAQAALAHVQNRQLHVEKTGVNASVPSDSTGRLMYYLGCMTGVLGDCIPGHLTNYQNYSSLSQANRQLVEQIAREYPPSKIPLFIEVDELPDNSGNEFLKFSSLEETITALGIHGDGAAMMALRRQVATQQLLKVMAYKPSWANNYYYGPLRQLQQQRQHQAELRRQAELQRKRQALLQRQSELRRQHTFYEYTSHKESSTCTLL